MLALSFSSSILQTIYFAIFESLLTYCSWSQDCSAIKQLVILRKKLLELLTFSYVTFTLVLYLKKVLF